MILAKSAILEALETGDLLITPFSHDQVDAAHVDLHLSLNDGLSEYVITPRTFITARTLETLTISSKLCGFIEGRAGLAKTGISVEQSSTFIEPGSGLQLVLEIFNASDQPYTLRNGQNIAKVYFSPLLTHLG